MSTLQQSLMKTRPYPAPARPLGCVERFFHAYARSYPVHFCVVGEIVGDVDTDDVRTALAQLQRRHTALASCIIEDIDRGTLSTGTALPIELRTAVSTDDLNWERLVEEELHTPFNVYPGPLMRAVLLRRHDRIWIILTFHHTIADALSAVRVLDDLLRALSGVTLECLPPPPLIEELLRARLDKTNVASDPQQRGTVADSKPKVPLRENIRPNVATLSFDEVETKFIVRSCRANNVTVGNAIFAAALRHVCTLGDRTARMHCPIDLNRLVDEPSEGCGVFIGAAVLDLEDDERRPLWDDARELSDRLRRMRTLASAKEGLERMASEFPPESDPGRLRNFFATQPQSSLVISNLGILPLRSKYGHLTLEAFWGPVMLTNPPGYRQTIGISTFNGRLRMVHQSYEPSPLFLEFIRARILDACWHGDGVDKSRSALWSPA